jgi:di/tripeptidase
VVISVGYRDIHTNQESMPIDELDRVAEVCRALMLG